MISQKDFILHYEKLYASKAVYVWGANGQIITKELMDKLFKAYGSTKYNETYYKNKLKDGEGKIGADCSGSIYPLSKKDATAKGYYNACPIKGSLKEMPKDTACLIFNANFTHVGAYLGNGYTIEMMSSAKNCVKQKLNRARWTYYGIPLWLETPKEIVKYNVKIVKNIQKWCNDFCDAGLKVDGDFGPLTKAGLVKALQTVLNVCRGADLKIDGHFGSKTKAKCMLANSRPELTYIAQAMLYYKGYDMSFCIINDNFNAIYDANMKAVVTEYQTDTRGLKQDGECGPATFYQIFNT